MGQAIGSFQGLLLPPHDTTLHTRALCMHPPPPCTRIEHCCNLPPLPPDLSRTEVCQRAMPGLMRDWEIHGSGADGGRVAVLMSRFFACGTR